jgi:protein tyrosine phosphatase (PTP) superfamily phosphohydrolase (DUF442 family)
VVQPPGQVVPAPTPFVPAPVPVQSPQPVLPQQSNLTPYEPLPDGSWQPKKEIHLEPPEPLKPLPPSPEGGTYLPEKTAEPPTEPADPILQTPVPSETQTAPKDRPAESVWPSGIPQFAVALREGVTNGLRPMLDGGLDWLRQKGYKTVLHLKRPGEDDAADRKQVEKRGMTYLSIEVSPETLSQQVVTDFSQIVSDRGNCPLFVYDKDGALAGALWYLYFREREDEEVARVRASALGLRVNGDGPHLEMWLAVKKYLSETAP